MIKFLFIGPLLLVFCFYVLIAPIYFQGGDTAELVNASYHLLVAHPPGYPLYIWLQHFWLTLTSFSTVYFRASLLSIFFTFGTLICLIWPLRRNIFSLLIPLVFLGLNPDFVESAILPDVFSLHGLFVAGILSSFLFEPRWKSFLIPFLFCLSLSNHHTTILLAPLLLYQIREMKKDFWLGLFIGLITCALMYLSLLGLDHNHPYSWGHVKDIDSIISHFLRKDYGTFKLAANGENQGPRALLFLLQSLLPMLVLTFVLFMKDWKRLIADKKVILVLTTLVICFGFSLMGNILPEHAGAEALKRFHIMPLVILTSLNVYVISLFKFPPKVKLVTSVILLSTLVFQGYILKDFMSFRNDSIIEDYSRNLLEAAKKNSPAIISVRSDTAFFGLRYVSSFEGNIFDKRMAIITPDMLFHPWFSDKVKRLLPEFTLNNKEKIFVQRKLNINQDLIKPNLKSYNFLMTTDYKEGSEFQLVFLPLGRVLRSGEGTYFDSSSIDELKFNYRPLKIPYGPQHFTRGFLYYQYSHFHMAQAYHLWSLNEPTKAKTEWENAIKKVNYALPAMENLCHHFPNTYDFCQAEKFKDLEKETKEFY